MSKSQIILGLDPGTATTGYGVVSFDGSDVKYITHGTIQTPAGAEPAHRLHTIAQELTQLIKDTKPDVIGMEEIYFSKNVSTAISVAQARGVLLATAAGLHVPVKGFTPLVVKKAITGYGKADKQQIQKMIKLTLGLKEIPKPDDAADGLAIAITAAYTKSNTYDR